jgi:hypothetical protein
MITLRSGGGGSAGGVVGAAGAVEADGAHPASRHRTRARFEMRAVNHDSMALG